MSSVEFHPSRFVVGIDLGTTTIAVSYVDTRQGRSIQPFPVPQTIAPGEVEPRPVLDSFHYTPAGHELPAGVLDLPWTAEMDHVVGRFARDHGAATPGRLVASAKSWLAHDGVDRTAGILPWQGDLGEAALSPVTVSRLYLEHVRAAWDHAMGGKREADGSPCYLADQQVVLTIPASFDETARELTVQAARAAGIRHLVLLEEPLAAFYAWLARREADWTEHLHEGEAVLVVDIGGGTTDFSLVAIDPGFVLRRTAAGEHLLLGGDNIDMAMARQAEAAWGTRLSARDFSLLCRQCQRAKETILSGATEATVRLAGTGSSVIASTRAHAFTDATVRDLLFEGFYPAIDAADPGPKRRTGMRTLDLPYVADPAVTRHLLAFLRQAARTVPDHPAVAGVVIPDAILFNGGSLMPEPLRTRLREVVGGWGGGDAIPELPSADLGLAVGRGAAYYGLVRRGEGVRVRGGIARAYYLEVHGRDGAELLCLMPRDTEEGALIELTGHDLQVTANQPVRFPLYSSATRLGDQAGDRLADREGVTQLPPLHTALAYGKKGEEIALDVRLRARLNEVGTLDLECATVDGTHHFPLTFDLRAAAGETGPAAEALADAGAVTVEAEVLERARAAVGEVFAGDAAPPALAKTLEGILGARRRDWGPGILRALADALLEQREGRTRSPEHESRWLNLCGFCMRPGYGAPGDAWRIKEAWKIWHAGPKHGNKAPVLADWWIFWRRVAGGLRAGQQEMIGGGLLKELLPKGGRDLGPKTRNNQVRDETWRALGALERLAVKIKTRILTRLVEAGAATAEVHLWVAARIGARHLLHGPANCVIPAAEMAKRLPALLGWIDRRLADGLPPRGGWLAVTNMARVTEVRGLDLDEAAREQARAWLARQDAPAAWIEAVQRLVRTDAAYDAELAGDALPLGLRLVSDAEEGDE